VFKALKLFIALFVLEVIFYIYFVIIDYKKLQFYKEKRIGSLSYKYFPELQLVLPLPNITKVHYVREFVDKFSTKDILGKGFGFFDDGLQKKKYNIVTMGDSFTYGVGALENKNNWIETVENMSDDMDILLLSSRIGIHGNKYDYDRLKNLIDHNVVILNFFSGGDFTDNLNDIIPDYYISKNINKYSEIEIQKIINELNIMHGYKYHMEYLANYKIKSFSIYFFLKLIDLAIIHEFIPGYKFNINILEMRANLVDDDLFNLIDTFKNKKKYICNKNNCYVEEDIFRDKNTKIAIIKNSANLINNFFIDVLNDEKKFILIIHPSARNFYYKDTYINYNELDDELINLLDNRIKIIHLKKEFDEEFMKIEKKWGGGMTVLDNENIFYKYDGYYNLYGYDLVSQIIYKKLKFYLN